MTKHTHLTYVLLVEDDAEDAALIQPPLEEAGFRVTTASTCLEARRMLSEGTYEVLLLDLGLPDGEGLDLLALARENTPDAVAVVIAGRASARTAVSALKRGAYDCLSKPCSSELLVATVRRAAEKASLARQLAQRDAETAGLRREADRRAQDSTRQVFLMNERLKRFVVELLEKNQAQADFLENAAHEMKNPLFVVAAYAGHILAKPMAAWTPDDLRTAFKAILRNTETLGSLVEELAEATRLSSRKVELHRQDLDAAGEAREAADMFRPQALANGIALSSEIGEGDLSVEADRLRLRQILSNLVSNAIKYTPTGGRVSLIVRDAGDAVHFTVEDTGIGIPERHLGRIFDRFYQAQALHGRKGLGLGLEITKGLVALHGGRIWVESEAGKGSRFHVALPKRIPLGDPVAA